jgi:Leucine-rich repeat (LRR) protein
MPIIEVLTINVGGAVIKAALKLWFKDSQLAQDVSLGIADILERQIPGFFERRRAERELAQAAEAVASKLAPYFDIEYGGLPQNEAIAAALEVARTIDNAEISPEILLDTDLQPASLERYLRDRTPDAARDAMLGEAAIRLYDFALAEASTFIVELAIALPEFSRNAAVEILRRETELITLVRRVLDNLPTPDPAAVNGNQPHHFETQYRRDLARALDRLELFGITISERSQRYTLSVAYITLIASNPYQPDSDERLNTRKRQKERLDTPKAVQEPIAMDRNHKLKGIDPRETSEGYLRVDEALSGCDRVLIRGEAGSGKTTLLQWIAVSSARQSFPGSLERWNGTIPFFIPLRRYANESLPPPEVFLVYPTSLISGRMPVGWAHEQLENGRALVLIDGLDELPEGQRRDARNWLVDLTDTYPAAKYIVTSRPPAVSDNWLDDRGFRETELQPMDLSDINSFIDHWHEAAWKNSTDDEDRTSLVESRRRLHSLVQDHAPIRALATSPLLCAMLCALSRDRKAELPQHRLELYRIALEMLLERRDIERRVSASPAIHLSLPEKLLLLQGFAYWLLINEQTDAAKPDVIGVLERRLAAMPHAKESGTAEQVFGYLLLRSGLLREPIEGRMDFVHRTFQEYLAAKEAVDNENMGLLVNSAHLDQWREVIILATGHARPRQRELLLSRLIERGDAHPQIRHRLHLLAVACLETSEQLSDELVRSLGQCLKTLIPPKNMTEARAVASAGELAVPQLGGYSKRPTNVVAACVRALSLIGTDTALQQIKRYSRDTRSTVIKELVKAWSSFEPESYVTEVLADSPLDHGWLRLRDPGLVPYATKLKNLQKLECRFGGKIKELDFVQNAPRVVILDASNTRIDSISPVAALAGTLRYLILTNCSRLSDVMPLASLRRLAFLDLRYCQGLTSLTGLEGAVELTELDMDWCGNVTSLEPLAGLVNLEKLSMSGDGKIGDLASVRELTKLRSLVLDNCESISDIGPLSGLSNLEQLSLAGCIGVRDIRALSELSRLQSLILKECASIVDISALAGLQALQTLSLSGLERLKDLAPLQNAERLNWLVLLNCGSIEDLTPLATLRRLKVLNLAGTGVTDLSPVGRLRMLQALDCGGLRRLTDLSPLSGLKYLSQLYLIGCKEPWDLRPLAALTSLRVLNVRGCSSNIRLTLPLVRRRGLTIYADREVFGS